MHCWLPQQDYGGPAANSGVLAVKPNHPIWDAAWSIIEERAKEKGEPAAGALWVLVAHALQQ